jgi:hypothetical protein
MTEPIKTGDNCRVIQGFAQGKSPNVGLTVKVGAAQGEHSRFGRVVRITGDGVKQMDDNGQFITTGWADCPVAWLEKIDPVKTNTTQEKEIAA